MKFDLGLSSLDLVILHGLGRQLKFFMFELSDFKFVKCGDGGAQVSGHSFRGLYQGWYLISFFFVSKQNQAGAQPRTSQAKTSTRENTRAQAGPRRRQGKVSQDKLKPSSNFKRKPSPV